ncbi:3-isopropylmalate dehydrogenase [Chelatococcus sp. GCM10030263]|uniref:3-isopropylmalate dehydrogenase n=1 Tax=Chelatococcus sp. GCM10030263 TaxID=3273387 RepID=UPI00361D7B05
MKIALLPGDGIGKEIVPEAVKILKALSSAGLAFDMEEAPIAGAGVDAADDPLPPETLALCRRSDAILFGAAGAPQYEALPRTKRPGLGLLRLRKELALFANYRPAKLLPELRNATTLKPEVVDGLDLLILRELNGDIYFGEPRGRVEQEGAEREAINTMRYKESEIARIAHVAFRVARGRSRKLCSVDKANVLETMVLWRQVVTEIGKQYPDVALTHMYVDAAAMALVRAPKDFDVILTGNMFGDILSDEAAMLTGSIGMLPSASLGEGKKGLYEPIHGSAPDIAGRNIANPLATILSAAMMLRYSFDLPDAADQIEQAVRRVLAAGLRTADIAEPGTTVVGTREMGDAVAAAL